MPLFDAFSFQTDWREKDTAVLDRQKLQFDVQKRKADRMKGLAKTYSNLAEDKRLPFYNEKMAGQGPNGQPIELTPQIHSQIMASTIEPLTRKEQFEMKKRQKEALDNKTFREFLPNIDVAQLSTDQNARNRMVKQILMRPDGLSPLAQATVSALKKPGASLAETLAAFITKRDLKGENRPVPPGPAIEIGGTAQAIANLDEMKMIMPSMTSGYWSPLVDPVRSINPWDVSAQAMKQYIATTKQVIGKGLEGGVLRKEDEIKYQKIIPKVGDLPATLKIKATQLRNMIVDKRFYMLQGLRSAGYNVSGFKTIEKTIDENMKGWKIKIRE